MGAGEALNGLRIKYGLGDQEPTEVQARAWGQRTRELVNAGVGAENAGAQAAREVFQTFGRFRYAGEADTIYDLLQTLGN